MNKRKNILIITAHCDDAELWVGGTIFNLRDTYNIFVAIAYPTKVRKKETKRSSKILGYIPIFNKQKELSKWIGNLLLIYKPEIILVHPYYDPHFEHEKVYTNTIKALTKHKLRKEYPSRWYMFDSYYLTNNISEIPPILIDISKIFKFKKRALSKHKSQNPKELITMSKAMNRINGLRSRVKYAEAFYPFNLLGRWSNLREEL